MLASGTVVVITVAQDVGLMPVLVVTTAGLHVGLKRTVLLTAVGPGAEPMCMLPIAVSPLGMVALATVARST